MRKSGGRVQGKEWSKITPKVALVIPSADKALKIIRPVIYYFRGSRERSNARELHSGKEIIDLQLQLK
jgi:hypothetical protein